MSYVLDPQEQELLDNFENGVLIDVKNIEQEKDKTSAIVKNTLAKRKSINLRIPERDLYKIKRTALEKGIPYQTLIISTLHQVFAKERSLASVV